MTTIKVVGETYCPIPGVFEYRIGFIFNRHIRDAKIYFNNMRFITKPIFENGLSTMTIDTAILMHLETSHNHFSSLANTMYILIDLDRFLTFGFMTHYKTLITGFEMTIWDDYPVYFDIVPLSLCWSFSINLNGIGKVINHSQSIIERSSNKVNTYKDVITIKQLISYTYAQMRCLEGIIYGGKQSMLYQTGFPIRCLPELINTI